MKKDNNEKENVCQRVVTHCQYSFTFKVIFHEHLMIKGTCNIAVTIFLAFLKPFNRMYSLRMYFFEF